MFDWTVRMMNAMSRIEMRMKISPATIEVVASTAALHSHVVGLERPTAA